MQNLFLTVAKLADFPRCSKLKITCLYIVYVNRINTANENSYGKFCNLG
jgi:hypothetical protein